MAPSQRLLLAFVTVIVILLVAGCTAEQQLPPQAAAPVGQAQEPEPPQPPEVPSQPSEAGQAAGGVSAVTASEVRMAIYHTGYEPSAIRVKRGSTVKIMAISQPVSHMHGITIDELGINEPVLSSDQNSPTVIAITPNQAGTFRIYCRTCWNGPFGKDHPDIQGALIVE